MARQRIHNSRAGRGASGGVSWISYSDMMAALLLIFVLILSYSLYEYFTMLETKTKELEEQQAIVLAQQAQVDAFSLQLEEQQHTLDEQTAALILAQTTLDEQAATLHEQTIALSAQQTELDEARNTLSLREAELVLLQGQLASQQLALDAATEVLNAQKEAMAAQTARIDDMVGMRTKIVRDLSSTLSSSGLRATVDESGAIVLESSVFFAYGSSDLAEEGKALLNRFLPAYMSVLLSPEYRDYLGEIIIEGHTDSAGNYWSNLKLSQERAQTVVEYVLRYSPLPQLQKDLLLDLIVPKGKSSTDLVYNPDGTENAEKSRRVEFKFSLRDAEMIEEMNRILQNMDSQ